ncbi:hybrid sensor histidine kinase/response regulator [Kitasatospora sp. NPDC101801]|uniref:ATP-binding response regulator n=1 Tax=Kitasatospora sp. NPDC101801 TaxID=3364103 RepID=UPI0037F365D4
MTRTPSDPGPTHLVTCAIRAEQDVFALRRTGGAVAEALGIERQDRVRLVTAISELGRDLLGEPGLTVEFAATGEPNTALVVSLRWSGGRQPGTDAMDAATRLLTRVVHDPARTRTGDLHAQVRLEQKLPDPGPTAQDLDRARALADPYTRTSRTDDLRARTQDLIAALEESRTQREELHRLNQELEETNRGVLALYAELSGELEETNRGVVALYAELETKTEELESTTGQLREASEAKTRFWANVSHELRTPANSVIGLARLLLQPTDGTLTTEQQRQAELIAASGTTLLGLVDELLDVAKAESGRLHPVWRAVDLGVLLSQLHDTLASLERPAGVELVLPELVGAHPLVTDEVMLTRILRNLLSNAIKFTQHGHVRLDVSTVTAPRGPELVLTVRDTGVGIPADQRLRVFEEFHQVAGAHQRGRSGTGLGLPYARRLAELLGGSLELTSAEGEGTTVTVTLPAGPGPAGGEQDRTAAGAPPPTAQAARSRDTRIGTLLFADDDAAFRAVMRPMLDQIAVHVTEARDGSEALELIGRARPDAILLDLHMPDVGGRQVLDRLAEDPGLRDVPVLVITAADPAGVDRTALAHARAVLDKRGLTLPALAAALLPAADPCVPGAPRPVAPPAPSEEEQ